MCKGLGRSFARKPRQAGRMAPCGLPGGVTSRRAVDVQHQQATQDEHRAPGANIERAFLDWSAPMIPQAARWLIEHGPEPTDPALPDCIDLRRTICVLPGRRAGRLLLEALARHARQSDRALLPPTITTPGSAVDILLDSASDPADLPVADSLTIDLAWMAALRDAPEELLNAIIASPPGADDWPAWYDLAATMHQVHEIVAGARQRFDLVADAAARRELLQEADRWSAMHEIHELYRQLLQRSGWTDPHDLREQMLNRHLQPGAFMHIALIGVVDLNQVQRTVILRASANASVTALVHAPRQLADDFDSIGCVVPERWRDVVIDHDDFVLRTCDRPADQAQRVIETIADYDGEFAADQITVGLGDDTLAPPIEHAAHWANLSMHHATGRPLSRSGPYRLLRVIAEWLADQRFANFAALVRHPDLERWLRRQQPGSDTAERGGQDWSTLLDDYFDAHLQQRVDGRWLGDAARQKRLKFIFDRVKDVLEPLNGHARPLHEWSAAIVELLRTLYDTAETDRAADPELRPELPPATRRACEQLHAHAMEPVSADPRLQPTVSPAVALRLLLMRCLREPVADNPRDDQIEMLGWLELHADPAPAMIIAGVNEGSIPSSATADLFLPDALRQQLGMPNNEVRFARDAYYMTAMAKSRQRITLLAGRRTATDEPLTPSRLLLTGDDDPLLQRATDLCAEPTDSTPAIPIGLDAPSMQTRFDVPDLPESIIPPASMRITDFRLYLRCPYRYALARLLGLQRRMDDAAELDPRHFGNLLHRTLQQFGNDTQLRQSTDARRIERELNDSLEEIARQAYGRTPMPSIRIQLSAAQRRLRAFARHQAELRRGGWEILHAEHSIPSTVELDVPDQPPMPITGTIDRIDYHHGNNRWRVIDYKTGERGESPVMAHHGSRRMPAPDECTWTDLQLPLYHYALHRSGIVTDNAPVELGYLLLPRDSAAVSYAAAEWTRRHLESAFETAQAVVRNIRDCRFDRNPDVTEPGDEFARLCHSEFHSTFASADDDEQGEVPQ